MNCKEQILQKIEEGRFSYYVSIGARCYPALDLIKLNIRYFSLPFDWLFSNYTLILEVLRTHRFPRTLFCEENLYQKAESPFQYFNPLYNTWFIHDYDDLIPLRLQLGSVKHKYERRTKRLIKTLREPCLLIRQCENQEEANYWNSHYAEAVSYVKKMNPTSDILLIANPGLTIDDNLFFVTPWAPGTENQQSRSPLLENTTLRDAFFHVRRRSAKKCLWQKFRKFVNTLPFRFYIRFVNRRKTVYRHSKLWNTHLSNFK